MATEQAATYGLFRRFGGGAIFRIETRQGTIITADLDAEQMQWLTERANNIMETEFEGNPAWPQEVSDP